VSSWHCDRCYAELDECEACGGTGEVRSPGHWDGPCRDCGSTGLQCPQHGGLWKSLLPEKEPSPMDDEDYFDVDFGDPNPFIVPSAWLDQLSRINCRLGEQGRIHEVSE